MERDLERYLCRYISCSPPGVVRRGAYHFIFPGLNNDPGTEDLGNESQEQPSIVLLVNGLTLMYCIDKETGCSDVSGCTSFKI